MFCNCLLYDIKCGFLKEYKKYIVAVILFLIIGFEFYNEYRDIKLTVFDYFFYAFFGMEEYVPSPGNRFRFPALWIALVLYSSYITLYYPFNDLNGYGKSVLLQCRDKRLWYLSKCVWVIISTVVYFIIGFIVLGFFSLVKGGEFCADVNSAVVIRLIPYLTTEEYLFYNDALFYRVSIVHFVLPVLVCIMNNLIQLLLSVFIKPFFSFIFTVSYAIVCTYYLDKYMLGNYAMIGRSTAFISNGVDFKSGCYLIVGMIVVSVILGAVCFFKKDILNRDGV